MPDIFDMHDLSPSSFDKLADRILEDEQLAIKYQNMKSNGGPEGRIESCNEACRRSLYCSIRHAIYEDRKTCEGLDVNNFMQAPAYVILNKLYGPWYTK